MYSSILSLPSAIDGVDGERQAPAALIPGNTRYPFLQHHTPNINEYHCVTSSGKHGGGGGRWAKKGKPRSPFPPRKEAKEKERVKVFLNKHGDTYRWRKCTTPLILTLKFTPRPLYLRDRTSVPNELETGGSQRQSGSSEEQEHLLPLSGFKPRIVQPVA